MGDQTEEYKKTRKIFVVELTKSPQSDPTEKIMMDEDSDMGGTDAKGMSSMTKETTVRRTESTIPALEFSDEQFEDQAVEFKSYVVQKGDTLQKISNKFYNSYNKWPQIYDSNRDVIKDPNFLKPGITIKIPVK